MTCWAVRMKDVEGKHIPFDKRAEKAAEFLSKKIWGVDREAEAARTRKMLNPLQGEALEKIEEKNRQLADFHNPEKRRNHFIVAESEGNPEGILIKKSRRETMEAYHDMKGLDPRYPEAITEYKFSCVYDMQVQDEEEEFEVNTFILPIVGQTELR